MTVCISSNCFKREMTSYLINFFSYLPTLLHSPDVPLNKKLIWRGLTVTKYLIDYIVMSKLHASILASLSIGISG